MILTSSVEGVGERGDVVSLKPQFAYNKVLLPGLGKYSDTVEINTEKLVSEAFNAKRVHIRTMSHFEQLFNLIMTFQTANILQRRVVAIVMNKDEPWTLEPWHIRVSLRKMGIFINDIAITMPEIKISGPDLAIQNKQFQVQIKVNDQESATVRCRIHHWSTDVKQRLPYVFEHWKMAGEQLWT